jgi:hypothetical protein
MKKTSHIAYPPGIIRMILFYPSVKLAHRASGLAANFRHVHAKALNLPDTEQAFEKNVTTETRSRYQPHPATSL